MIHFKKFIPLFILILMMGVNTKLSAQQPGDVLFARISITMQDKENHTTQYKRLKGQEALDFDLEKFIQAHPDQHIKISGSMTKEVETMKLKFDSEEFKKENSCDKLCLQTTSIEKLPLLGVAADVEDGVESGVVIQKVIDGSAAKRAGLKAGDILTFIEEEPIFSSCDLRTIVSKYEPGTAIDLHYLRDGKEKYAQTILGYKLKRNMEWQSCCSEALTNHELGTGPSSAFRVFPNPTEGLAQFQYQSSEEEGLLQVVISNVAGKEIYRETINRFNGNYDGYIDLTDKASGVYFLNIIHAGEIHTEKIILQKR